MDSKTFFVRISHECVAIPERSWGLWLCHYPCPMSETFLQTETKRVACFNLSILVSDENPQTNRRTIPLKTKCGTHCTWSPVWPDRWQSCQSQHSCRPPCSAGWSAGTGCWSTWNLTEKRQTGNETQQEQKRLKASDVCVLLSFISCWNERWQYLQIQEPSSSHRSSLCPICPSQTLWK